MNIYKSFNLYIQIESNSTNFTENDLKKIGDDLKLKKIDVSPS